MSEDHLSALLAQLKNDADLKQKLQAAGDLDAAVAIAQEAGFEVNKADWIRYQAKQTLELSDAELEGMAGGGGWYESKWYLSALAFTGCCGSGW